jgi:hypothetical protein
VQPISPNVLRRSMAPVVGTVGGVLVGEAVVTDAPRQPTHQHTATVSFCGYWTCNTASAWTYNSVIPITNNSPAMFELDNTTVDAFAICAPPVQSEAQQISSAILEMRPAHRSLRDKAQEEMSEFEREYPW